MTLKVVEAKILSQSAGSPVSGVAGIFFAAPAQNGQFNGMTGMNVEYCRTLEV